MTQEYKREQYASTCPKCGTTYTPLHDKGFGMKICPRCHIKMRELTKEEKKAEAKWIKSALEHWKKELRK